MISSPRLVQTFLLDGTLEGIRVVDCESTVEAYVIPRLRLGEAKGIVELEQPALYILLNAEDNRAYIGESESFYSRAGQHLKSKDWWTLAVAIVSKTNDLEKGDVKYLESLAVERARGGSINLENSTIPPRNNVHKFKLHKLEKVLDDIQLILTLLGYDVLYRAIQSSSEDIWYCVNKQSKASAIFRGNQFIVLAGSQIDLSFSPVWEKSHPFSLEERNKIIKNKADVLGGVAVLRENIAFTSPNQAGGFVMGRNANAWTTWKNSNGQTMDEVMRRSDV